MLTIFVFIIMYITPSGDLSMLFVWVDSETFLLGVFGHILIHYHLMEDSIFK